MKQPIKCLVWDLDDTLWQGTLLEGGACRLRPGIKNILKQLDRRGILLSIASANDREDAQRMLGKRGVADVFLHPQIGWANKVASLQAIAKMLNLGLDTIGYIDNEPFEREQVQRMLPQVRTYRAEDYRDLPQRPEFRLRFKTKEGRRRRETYVQESVRRQMKQRLGMSQREFLDWCKTEVTFRKAESRDRERILELLHRTHQLNATGKIYRESQVRRFLERTDHRVYVAELKDRFVDYGTIGVAICACSGETWRLVSFILSCRVLGRGVGSVFLAWLQRQARIEGAETMEGAYVPQPRNHRMYVLYAMSGFKPARQNGDGSVIFSRTCRATYSRPEWMMVRERDVA